MMAEHASRLLFALSLASMAGAASAQSDPPWNGGYVGPNLGEASTNACNSWSAGGTTFDIRNCPGSSFVGGVQIGDNFQYKRLVWGLEADLDIWRGGNRSETVRYAGAALPPGTYSASGRLTPGQFAIIAPRIGYAGILWMPYVTAGFITPLRSQKNTPNYPPRGCGQPHGLVERGQELCIRRLGGRRRRGMGIEWSLVAQGGIPPCEPRQRIELHCGVLRHDAGQQSQ